MSDLDQAALDAELLDRLLHLWRHGCLSEDEAMWLETVRERLAVKPLGQLTSRKKGRSLRAGPLEVYISKLTADERRRGDAIVRRYV
jgi:hypothetical protein